MEIKAFQCEIESFRHRFLSYGIHDDIGFRLSAKHDYVGMPKNDLAEKNSLNNQDEWGGFLAHGFMADCENGSDLKPQYSASKEIGKARRIRISEAIKINHDVQGSQLKILIPSFWTILIILYIFVKLDYPFDNSNSATYSSGTWLEWCEVLYLWSYLRRFSKKTHQIFYLCSQRKVYSFIVLYKHKNSETIYKANNIQGPENIENNTE